MLARGRAAALQLMVDECLIERLTPGSFNSTTGDYADVWAEIYSGRCRLKSQGGGSAAQFGEHEVSLASYQVVLPWDMGPEIRIGDRVTITACEDSWVIGRHLDVTDVALNGISTARRITVQDRS